MKKSVIVRKCKRHRILLGVFSLLPLIAITICVIYADAAAMLLSYIPVLAILSPVLVYFFSWQIHFEEGHIIKSVFFRNTRMYSYSQLQKITKRYSLSESDVCICMYFTDGRMLQFRMDDENAVKAVKKLQKHRSIHIA